MENLIDDIADVVISDLSLVASIEPIPYDSDYHKMILAKFDERGLPFEDNLRRVMVSIFRQQRNEVIDNLFRISPKSFVKDYTNDIFDRVKWDDVIREDGGNTIRQIVEMEGYYIATQFGTSFDILAPNITEFFDYKIYNTSIYNYPIMVNDTTENMLRTILSEGLREGQTTWDISRRFNEVFDFAESDRAMRIARTETTEAMNFSDNELYKQAGFIKFKRWIATLDDRVRDSHAKLHNAVAKVGAKFANGLEYPGDSRAGKPAEIVNCRCTTIAVLPV